MAYKSLLSILVDTADLPRTLDAAIRLAGAQDAHLDVLSLGVDRLQVGYTYLGSTVALVQAALDRAADDARALDEAAQARLRAESIRWGAEGVVVQAGAIAPLVGLRARTADLVVLPHPYGPDCAPEAVPVLEAALFEGGAPVLLLPRDPLPEPLGRRVVIAWNEGREAAVAVRAALPLLRAAEAVNVAVVDPGPASPDRSDPGGALCQMLARHGVRAEVSVLARTMTRISDVLQRHARDFGADLLVMGAYGHSRLREAIVGGATRDMLEEAETAVFLAR